jgi:homoserine O-succinyltransferase/O-acetyltransferase
MSVAIEGGRVPALLQQLKPVEPSRSLGSSHSQSDPLRIALVNNMPDPALEDTELQFFELLSAAAGDTAISLKFFSLPNLPRTAVGQRHLNSFYSGVEDLLSTQFDGAIITGTEPRRPNLREEPYWQALVDVLEWAENNTASAVLSCLAAHAGVLASDDIPRHPLGEKQFGVFEYRKMSSHALTKGIGDGMRIPHSRWNEVKADVLAARGYEILTQSETAGVDLFVKQRKRSLFVHFQGHPEYSTRTLLKEYRRDIKRFLRRERETYPSMPHGYFAEPATQLLAEFRQKAMTERREEMLAEFPEAEVAATVQNGWQASASVVYRNWLQHLVARRAENPSLLAMAPATRAGLARARWSPNL